MFKLAAASRRPAYSEQQPMLGPTDPRPRKPREDLTRAQAKALSRCAPLTPGEFKARRLAAEQGLVSLRGVLDEGPEGPTSAG